MKLPTRTGFACGLAIAIGWLACDGRDPSDTAPGLEPVGEAEELRTSDSTSGEGAGLAGVRARAEAAFEDPAIRPERYTTRVGPQPWPTDLPSQWPKPAAGRVVADSKRAGGERLLLVDLPGSADEAFADYRRSLRDGRFEIDETSSDSSKLGLRVRRGSDQATLRFFDREHRTRVEILFLARSDS